MKESLKTEQEKEKEVNFTDYYEEIRELAEEIKGKETNMGGD